MCIVGVLDKRGGGRERKTIEEKKRGKTYKCQTEWLVI
jgi:hypothetical protein